MKALNEVFQFLSATVNNRRLGAFHQGKLFREEVRELTHDWVKAIWRVLWKVAVFVLLWGVFYAPLLIPGINKFQRTGNIDSPLARLYIDVSGAITVLVAAWVMTRFIDKRSLASLGFKLNHIIRDISLGLVIGLRMMVLSVGVLWAAGWAAPQSVVTFSLITLVLVGVSMLANTIIQKVLVRGYIQQAIQSQSGSISQ